MVLFQAPYFVHLQYHSTIYLNNLIQYECGDDPIQYCYLGVKAHSHDEKFRFDLWLKATLQEGRLIQPASKATASWITDGMAVLFTLRETPWIYGRIELSTNFISRK